jgi:hypothetical protein
VVSAALVAVTLKAPAVFPAVYIPVLEMLPPEAAQVTAMLVDPVTDAENCCVLPVCREAEMGLTVMATVVGGGSATVDLVEAAQEASERTASSAQTDESVARTGRSLHMSFFAPFFVMVSATLFARGSTEFLRMNENPRVVMSWNSRGTG